MHKIYENEAFGYKYDKLIDDIINKYDEKNSIALVQELVYLSSDARDSVELKRMLNLKSLKYKIISENILTNVNFLKSFAHGPSLIASLYISVLIAINKFLENDYDEIILGVILVLIPLVHWFFFIRNEHYKIKESNKLKKISYLLECAEKLIK